MGWLHILSCSATMILLTCPDFTHAQSAMDEDRLWDDLLKKSPPPNTRPLKNLTRPVTVYVGLSLIQWEDLHEIQKTLHAHYWSRLLWHDDYKKWDPTDYGGITTLRRPISHFWQPDVSVYNAVGPTETESKMAVLYNDGNVLYIPPMQIRSFCEVDVTYFPYDTQTCTVKLGSWTFSGEEIDLEFYEGQKKIDLADYRHHNEWDIIGSTAEKIVTYYPCCVEPYPTLTFNITVKRKPGYLIYAGIGPPMLLALLIPFIFLLHPGDQQKMILGMGILICLTLCFLLLRTKFGGWLPLVDKFLFGNLVLAALSIVLSTFVANLARRAQSLRHPPEIVKKVVVGCLGRLLCVSTSDYTNVTNMETQDTKNGDTSVLHRQTSGGSQVGAWHVIATVLDRFFFIVFLVLVVLLALSSLCDHP